MASAKQILRKAAVEAAVLLVDIMRDTEQNPKLRSDIAADIIDRVYGKKPVQPEDSKIKILLSEELQRYAK